MEYTHWGRKEKVPGTKDERLKKQKRDEGMSVDQEGERKRFVKTE